MTTVLREDRTRLFENLAHPETIPAFFRRVADDVDWTVQGTHPLAGRWTDRTTFVAQTSDGSAP
ncbi:hypothetical protein [Actinomycetospora termitidis]|uniref:Polyketide cyclase n=1 Tax=Actinomycetospora termitidis TaxID=3053470 RepID=A0ABT7ME95_9PSEU|nr:hypothetical protein [Actinomycetospora sp. Odt1-22]MDL5158322.1 hypothetical protein [Actinomycetospora sp. Odt1-22]